MGEKKTSWKDEFEVEYIASVRRGFAEERVKLAKMLEGKELGKHGGISNVFSSLAGEMVELLRHDPHLAGMPKPAVGAILHILKGSPLSYLKDFWDLGYSITDEQYREARQTLSRISHLFDTLRDPGKKTHMFYLTQVLKDLKGLHETAIEVGCLSRLSEIDTFPLSEYAYHIACDEIIMNASKYGADWVKIREAEKDHAIWLQFADNGWGIPPDKIGVVNNLSTRLYPDVSGSGQGISLIRGLGFDRFHLRIPTEEEFSEGIRTVAELPIYSN